MHLINVPPPPSYDQIDSHPPAAAARDSIGYDLTEKVAEQSTVIRVQELEIGKLRRDLGRVKEQMERMEHRTEDGQQLNIGKTVPMPPKLEQTLAQVVSEEAEQRRRTKRSRKGDVIGGLVCFVALMAVLGLGTYIVLNKPSNNLINTLISDQDRMENGQNSSVKSTKQSTTEATTTKTEEAETIVRHFHIVGKANGDNLCWARAILSSDQRRAPNHCIVFRRSLDDQRLFCTFPLGHSIPPSFDGTTQNDRFSLPIGPRGKAVILLKNRQRLRTSRKGFGTFYTHSLSRQEAAQARATCAERLPLFRRFGGRRGTFVGGGQKMPIPPQSSHWALQFGSRHHAQ